MTSHRFDQFKIFPSSWNFCLAGSYWENLLYLDCQIQKLNFKKGWKSWDFEEEKNTRVMQTKVFQEIFLQLKHLKLAARLVFCICFCLVFHVCFNLVFHVCFSLVFRSKPSRANLTYLLDLPTWPTYLTFLPDQPTCFQLP